MPTTSGTNAIVILQTHNLQIMAAPPALSNAITRRVVLATLGCWAQFCLCAWYRNLWATTAHLQWSGIGATARTSGAGAQPQRSSLQAGKQARTFSSATTARVHGIVNGWHGKDELISVRVVMTYTRTCTLAHAIQSMEDLLLLTAIDMQGSGSMFSANLMSRNHKLFAFPLEHLGPNPPFPSSSI